MFSEEVSSAVWKGRVSAGRRSGAARPRCACPRQRHHAQLLQYLTFTIVISKRQELIILNNNKYVSSFSPPST